MSSHHPGYRLVGSFGCDAPPRQGFLSHMILCAVRFHLRWAPSCCPKRPEASAATGRQPQCRSRAPDRSPRLGASVTPMGLLLLAATPGVISRVLGSGSKQLWTRLPVSHAAWTPSASVCGIQSRGEGRHAYQYMGNTYSPPHLAASATEFFTVRQGQGPLVYHHSGSACLARSGLNALRPNLVEDTATRQAPTK